MYAGGGGGHQHIESLHIYVSSSYVSCFIYHRVLWVLGCYFLFLKMVPPGGLMAPAPLCSPPPYASYQNFYNTREVTLRLCVREPTFLSGRRRCAKGLERYRQDGCQAWNQCFRSLSLPVSNGKTRKFERPSGRFIAFFVAAKQGIIFNKMLLGKFSSCVCRNKTWHFQPKHDLFLTLTKCFLFVPKPYQRVHIQCQHLFWRRGRTQTTYDWLHNAVSFPIAAQTKYSDWDFSRVLFGFVGAGWVIVWIADSICDVPAGRYDLPPSGQWRVWPSCHSVKEKIIMWWILTEEYSVLVLTAWKPWDWGTPSAMLWSFWSHWWSATLPFLQGCMKRAMIYA